MLLGACLLDVTGNDGGTRVLDLEHPSSEWASRSAPSVWKVLLPKDQSFALLIRVWFEDGAENFRARVATLGGRSEQDEPRTDSTVAVASSPREVVSAVSGWLDAVVRHGGHPIDGEA
jgi:hypothetical protein